MHNPTYLGGKRKGIALGLGPETRIRSRVILSVKQSQLQEYYSITINRMIRCAFSAYYAVYKCTQTHAARCGGRIMTKSPLRQIYQGLDHNCRPFKPVCDKMSGTSGSGGATGPGGGAGKNTIHKPKTVHHYPPASKNRGNAGAGSAAPPRSFSSRRSAPLSILLLAVVVTVAAASTVISLAVTP